MQRSHFQFLKNNFPLLANIAQSKGNLFAKTFLGELVPQHSQGEPAAKLLERIKALQEEVKTQKRIRK